MSFLSSFIRNHIFGNVSGDFITLFLIFTHREVNSLHLGVMGKNAVFWFLSFFEKRHITLATFIFDKCFYMDNGFLWENF